MNLIQFTSTDDRFAETLYEAIWQTCLACNRSLTLADVLGCICPDCGREIEPGPDISPGEAAQMLAALKRRRELLDLE